MTNFPDFEVTTFVPLIIDGVLLGEDIKCTAECVMEDGEPYISELRCFGITGNKFLRLTNCRIYDALCHEILESGDFAFAFGQYLTDNGLDWPKVGN